MSYCLIEYHMECVFHVYGPFASQEDAIEFRGVRRHYADKKCLAHMDWAIADMRSPPQVVKRGRVLVGA